MFELVEQNFRKLIRHITTLHTPTLYSCGILMFIGVIMSLSLSPVVAGRLETGHFLFFFKHVFFLLIGLCVTVFISTQSTKNIVNICKIGAIISFIMLVLVLVCGTGIKGAKRWIDLGVFKLQPSELLKPFFLFLVADYITSFAKTLSYKYIIKGGLMLVVAVILFFLEPDFGMMIVFAFIFAVQIFFSPIRIRYLLLCGGLFFALLIVASLSLEHVRFRVNNFLYGSVGDSYQKNTAIKAIKSGGVLGNGLGEGNLKFQLPDAHNDFIFSIIGEELGLFAYCILFIAYLTICVSNIMIVYDSEFVTGRRITLGEYKNNKHHNKLLHDQVILGIICLIFFEVMINASVSLGLMPTKGMTLPFVSYGGSSILSHSVLLGILLAFTKRQGGIHYNQKSLIKL